MRTILRSFTLLAVLVALASASASVLGQSQGVGVTITGPASSPGVSPTPGTTDPGGTVTDSTSPDAGDQTTFLETRQGGGSAGNGPLPRTGLDVLKLLALGLGLITVGDTLIRATRRRPLLTLGRPAR